MSASPYDPSVTITIDEELERSRAGKDGLDDPLRYIAAGTVVHGRFELIEKIGEGGSSTVYKAVDRRKAEAGSTAPFVAIKLLKLSLSSFVRSMARIQSEAAKLLGLAHPNIVRVFDCDRDGTTLFMTMEYLGGQSLKERLGQTGFNGLPVEEADSLVSGIANGLAFAHRSGIVHGDLKPGNVIITAQGEAKIIDFGIARVLEELPDEARVVRAGTEPLSVAYTPLYASPALLERHEPTQRDDVYALACIAYEMLVGTPPFGGQVATAARDAGLRLRRPRGMLRRHFIAIQRGLRFDAERRTPSATRFLANFIGPTPPQAGGRWRLPAAVAIVLLLAILLTLVASRWPKLTPPATVTGGPSVGEEFSDCSDCPLMKVLPAGRFSQGTGPSDAGASPIDQPQHAVVLEYPFAMGVNEVTVAQFAQFASATGFTGSGCERYQGEWQWQKELSWSSPGFPQSATHPVTCVSWQDANNYAQWLSRTTGQHYRLPSASEWEYAARAGTTASRPWGASDAGACAAANVADAAAAEQFPGWKVHGCNDGFVYTAPVGSFAANSFGLHDLLGNAAEWVEDCWNVGYQHAPNDGSAWLSGDCAQRETRGGSWFTEPSRVGVDVRSHFAGGYRGNSVGFRVVRDIHR